jgi:hypothetical protein
MAHSSPTNTAGYFQRYINLVAESNLTDAFNVHRLKMTDLLEKITEEKALFAYAPGKWTVKQLMQHIIDTERIFSYRALCFARGEKVVLPGFDEDAYADAATAATRSWQELAEEMKTVRKATEMLFSSFSNSMLQQIGTASNNQYSVEQIGFILLGHFEHHANILAERYGCQ